MEAARFLKRSGLSDIVLSRVWDLSDPGGRGCLDKAGMFVALKLVALAQQGRDINLANLNMDMPPPKMVSNYPILYLTGTVQIILVFVLSPLGLNL